MTLTTSATLKADRRSRLHRELLIVAAILVAILGIVALLLWFSIPGPPRPTPTHSRMSNMHYIGLALNQYASEHGAFPPAYLADDQGRPMHSWRVLILPQLEAQDLYDEYNFDEPWDGPNNRKLIERMPAIYGSGNYDRERMGYPVEVETRYVLPVGPKTISRPTKSLSFAEITDGMDKTVLLVEAKSPVCWMEPADISISELREGLNVTEAGRKHDAGFLVVFADAHLQILSLDIPPKLLEAMTTADTGDAIPPDTF